MFSHGCNCFSGVIAKVGITDYDFCAWYVQPLYSRSTAAVLLGWSVLVQKTRKEELLAAFT